MNICFYKNTKEIWEELEKAKSIEEIYSIIKKANQNANIELTGRWFCTDEYTEDTHNAIVMLVLNFGKEHEISFAHTFKFEEKSEIEVEDTEDYEGYNKISCLKFKSPDGDCWPSHRRKQLIEQHKIFFKGDVMPVKLVKGKSDYPLFVIGWEDDGQIGFYRHIHNNFICEANINWIDNLIENLRDAKEYWLEHKEEFINNN